MRILVALGGNAMTNADGRARPEDQIAAAQVAMRAVAGLVAEGHEVVLTHGNGPQVGNLLVKNELAAGVVPPVPLDWCGAQTQATLGFVLANALEAALADLAVERPTAALVTRTLVDPDDPGFDEPTKPIGRYLPEDEARVLVEHGETWEDRGEKGWRRVVASPEPLEVLEARAVRSLLEAGYVVIANGGGGIPMVRDGDGRLRGVEAVIDKDLSAALLGAVLEVDVLVIATDVPHAVLRFGEPDAEPIGLIEVATLREHAAAGHFASGSMGPKVDAACRFVEGGGVRSAIASLEDLRERLPGTSAPSSYRLDGRNHMPDAIEVRKVPIHSVADASELARLIDDGVMEAARVIAIIGKTEGNGGVNDYTRIIADRAFREVLVDKGADPAAVKEVPIVWSGGTDGVISPHATIFATVPGAEPGDQHTDEPRLTVGFAMSDQLRPEDIGRVAMIEKVAAAVRVAMERAGITDPADVHYVQTKTPLLTIQTIRDAKSRGEDRVDRAHPRVDGPLQRLHRARHRRGAGRDRHAERRGRHARPVAVLVGRVVLVGRRARPGAGRGGRQRDGCRRPLPDRARRHEGRARRRRHLGRDPLRRARPARSPAPLRPRRSPGQRLPQVRGVAGRTGARSSQRDARRLRRALAPPDQGLRRWRHRRRHR